MKAKLLILSILIVLSASDLPATGSAAEGGASARGTYLARSGYIIHPGEIQIEHYVAQRDYDYPLPDGGDLRVITGSGISADATYILLGLKGKRVPFEDLPPLNIAFCIDRSGSMTNMIPWVKSSFYVFIDRVRDGDIVSLVDMDTRAQTLIPPTVISSSADRTDFKRQVDRITATGGTDVYAGMQRSYKELEGNYDPGFVNRVVILTDGMHNSGEMTNRNILELAAAYRKKGIGISTVLLGIQAATGLMVDVAIEGGGSSRFISDHDEMVKVFQTELDRMLVPAARELEMRLVLSKGVVLENTWGYRHRVTGNEISYHLPTLHNGDYETMLAEVTLAPGFSGPSLGAFYLDYVDLGGTPRSLGPFEIRAESPVPEPIISDPRVREAVGYLRLARGLMEIGANTLQIRELEQELSRITDAPEGRAGVTDRILLGLASNLEQVQRLAGDLVEISSSLGGVRYETELEILKNYVATFTAAYDLYDGEEEQGD